MDGFWQRGDDRMTDVSSGSPSAFRDSLAALARWLLQRFPVRVYLVVATVGMVTFVVLGILQRTSYPHWRLANLDSESAIATYFSAGLLWVAFGAWVIVAILTPERRATTWLAAAMVGLLAFDEGYALHERLERITGVDWQLLYLPVLLVAVGIARGLLRDRRLDRPSRLLLAAAAAWGVAMFFELIQNWGGEPVGAAIYDPTMIAEEGLEMIGSMLIATAGLWWLGETASNSTSSQYIAGTGVGLG